MLAPKTDGLISEADYLAGEKLADVRHEYVNGRVYAMAGTSRRHNRIAMNIIRHLPLQGARCMTRLFDRGAGLSASNQVFARCRRRVGSGAF